MMLSEEEVERTRRPIRGIQYGNPYFGMERIILKDGRSYDTIVQKYLKMMANAAKQSLQMN